jgi:hypothetical protein
MMHKHARGTTHYNVDPTLEEMREMMFSGKLIIAPHNHELIDEMRNYHRDQNFKLVKQRDDMVSALRYAIMCRWQGKSLPECDGVGFGSMPYAGQRRANSGATMARDIDFDLF